MTDAPSVKIINEAARPILKVVTSPVVLNIFLTNILLLDSRN